MGLLPGREQDDREMVLRMSNQNSAVFGPVLFLCFATLVYGAGVDIRTLRDLLLHADLVCIGKIVDVHDTGKLQSGSVTNDPFPMTRQIAKVRVVELFRGPSSVSTLSLHFYGFDKKEWLGTPDPAGITGDRRFELALQVTNAPFLMFLKRLPDNSYRPLISSDPANAVFQLEREDQTVRGYWMMKDAHAKRLADPSERLHPDTRRQFEDWVRSYDIIMGLSGKHSGLSGQGIDTFRRYLADILNDSTNIHAQATDILGPHPQHKIQTNDIPQRIGHQ